MTQTVERILNDHFYTGEPGQQEAIKAAAELLQVAALRTPIITFGMGLYGVDIGTYLGNPAVFVMLNEKCGAVGERIPLELQGPLERELIPEDRVILVFPTIDRCKEVADALVGSKMEKWTKDSTQ